MSDDTELAEMAGAGLNGDQPQLDGTQYAQVRFVGMAWETAEVPDLKEEVKFTVEGMVVGHGQEVMASGEVRDVAKVQVQRVTKI